jgi:hypothetical protein
MIVGNIEDKVVRKGGKIKTGICSTGYNHFLSCLERAIEVMQKCVE